MSERADVVIAGGGFAGLGLAVALACELGMGFTVTVVDPALGTGPSKDGRASAIAAAARRFFERLGAWEPVAGDAQPMLDMVVTDSRLKDPIRPTFLTFGGDVEPGEPFAHMIENRHLIDALAARAGVLGVRLVGGGASVDRAETSEGGVEVHLSPGGGPRDAAFGGRGRRALAPSRAGRDRDAWLGLRAVRHRDDGRA